MHSITCRHTISTGRGLHSSMRKLSPEIEWLSGWPDFLAGRARLANYSQGQRNRGETSEESESYSSGFAFVVVQSARQQKDHIVST